MTNFKEQIAVKKRKSNFLLSIISLIVLSCLVTILNSCVDSTQATQNQVTVTQTGKPETTESLPNKFKMKQAIITIGTDMSIESDGNNFGKIEERTLNFGTTFEYFDSRGNKKATAKESVMSLVTTINIFDENGNNIGQVKEEVLKGFFSTKSYYTISDANGNLIGESEKSDWLATNVEINSPNGDVICTMHRPMINVLSDTWTVEILKTGYDNRLFLFIPCYKTSADDERSKNK